MPKDFIKKWLFILLLIISCFVIGLRTGIGFFYFFFCFLVSLVVLSFSWIIIGYLFSHITLTRKVQYRVEEEEVLKVEVVFENSGFLPLFNCVLEDYLSPAAQDQRNKQILLHSIWGKSQISLTYDCVCSLRGGYKIGPLAVYFFDPLGLFFFKKVFAQYSDLYVYPKTFKIRKFPQLIKGVLPWFGIEATRVSGDDDDFFGVREYKQGDPISRIHWFSTARKNHLIVKQFQHQNYFRAGIVFSLERSKNIGQGRDNTTEYTVKIAASVAKYLIEKDVSLGLLAHAGELVYIPFNKGQEHLEDILKFLAVAKADSNVSLEEIFEEFSSYMPSDSTLVVIIQDGDWEYLSQILFLTKKNVSIIPIILVTASFLSESDENKFIKDTAMKLSYSYGLNPIFVSRQDNLEGLFVR